MQKSDRMRALPPTPAPAHSLHFVMAALSIIQLPLSIVHHRMANNRSLPRRNQIHWRKSHVECQRSLQLPLQPLECRPRKNCRIRFQVLVLTIYCERMDRQRYQITVRSSGRRPRLSQAIRIRTILRRKLCSTVVCIRTSILAQRIRCIIRPHRHRMGTKVSTCSSRRESAVQCRRRRCHTNRRHEPMD